MHPYSGGASALAEVRARGGWEAMWRRGPAVMSCHTFCDLNLPSKLRTVESTVHNTYFGYFSYFLSLFGYAASGILCAARPGLPSIAGFRYSRGLAV